MPSFCSFFSLRSRLFFIFAPSASSRYCSSRLRYASSVSSPSASCTVVRNASARSSCVSMASMRDTRAATSAYSTCWSSSTIASSAVSPAATSASFLDSRYECLAFVMLFFSFFRLGSVTSLPVLTRQRSRPRSFWRRSSCCCLTLIISLSLVLVWLSSMLSIASSLVISSASFCNTCCAAKFHRRFASRSCWSKPTRASRASISAIISSSSSSALGYSASASRRCAFRFLVMAFSCTFRWRSTSNWGSLPVFSRHISNPAFAFFFSSTWRATCAFSAVAPSLENSSNLLRRSCILYPSRILLRASCMLPCHCFCSSILESRSAIIDSNSAFRAATSRAAYFWSSRTASSSANASRSSATPPFNSTALR
mmetsp:Transcript_11851/g.21685  ORF Transcript_11851/g.21685 Transcript_11851/m.21685 type:complete len:369 (-) Transcript_11851:411-1517(-)